MLFSKYGFATLDTTLNTEGFQETWHDGAYDDNIARWDIYTSDNTNGADAWANKGFALVRIVNECDGRLPFNVGFTHMQSSPGHQQRPSRLLGLPERPVHLRPCQQRRNVLRRQLGP